MTSEQNSRFDRRGADAEIPFVLIITVYVRMEWVPRKLQRAPFFILQFVTDARALLMPGMLGRRWHDGSWPDNKRLKAKQMGRGGEGVGEGKRKKEDTGYTREKHGEKPGGIN